MRLLLLVVDADLGFGTGVTEVTDAEVRRRPDGGQGREATDDLQGRAQKRAGLLFFGAGFGSFGFGLGHG